MTKLSRRTVVRGSAIGGIAVAGTAALLITTLPAVAETSDDTDTRASCELELLPEPDETEVSFTTHIDPTGSWVAGRIYPDGPVDVRIWHDGEIIDPGVPGSDRSVQDINSAGTTVGMTYHEGTGVPWAYEQGGETVILAAPDDGSEQVWARSVNDDGVIVGVSQTGILDEINALLWTSIDAEPEILELPEGAVAADARDISEDGTIVGFYVDENDDRVPYTWDTDGNGEALPGLESDPLNGVANVIAGDWIIGTDEANDVPVVWEPGAETAAAVPELDSVRGVSENGDLSGSANGYAALVTAEGEAVQLPGMVEHSGEPYESAEKISADGSTIVGHVVDENGDRSYHAALWHCE